MGNIAIIPARSGSKGIKDKNIKLLNGLPLIAYTIKAAIDSNIFEEIMVSTDSPEYAQIAKNCGASVPFLRSAINAGDVADSWSVVREVLGHYGEMGQTFDSFCLLQPTSPLRTAQDIQEAYWLYQEKDAVAVVSVCECEHSPNWCNVLNKDLSMENFVDSKYRLPRQKLEKYYRINGAIYIMDTKTFKENPCIYVKGSYAYIMAHEHSVDIDTMIDFKFAGLLLAENARGGVSNLSARHLFCKHILIRRCA